MRAVTQSGRRSAVGRNGSSAQYRLLAKSGHFGPRLLPGGTLSTRSSALPPDPKRRLPGEAAIERPTNSPTPERQAFPQAAWSHAQGVEEGTWIGLASRAWRSRPRTTLDRPHPQNILVAPLVARQPRDALPARAFLFPSGRLTDTDLSAECHPPKQELATMPSGSRRHSAGGGADRAPPWLRDGGDADRDRLAACGCRLWCRALGRGAAERGGG
jgi:hypothetical protein